MLEVAIAEACQGLAEGGIPIGATLFDRKGNLLGRGHNRSPECITLLADYITANPHIWNEDIGQE